MRLLTTICCLLLAASAHAAERVSLELVLLADSTGSIDDTEITFQRQGYAEAITHPDVLDAITFSGEGRIAVTYVEWGDYTSQAVVVPWSVIGNAADAEKFAADLLAVQGRRAFGRNAIGAALLKGRDMILENGIDSFRQVIDLSGDSANNWNGPTVGDARTQVLDAGITINGLAILCRYCESGRAGSGDLEFRYETEIIGGPGAFVVTADDMLQFAAAVRRKLVLEISAKMPERRFAAGSPAGN